MGVQLLQYVCICRYAYICMYVCMYVCMTLYVTSLCVYWTIDCFIIAVCFGVNFSQVLSYLFMFLPIVLSFVVATQFYDIVMP